VVKTGRPEGTFRVGTGKYAAMVGAVMLADNWRPVDLMRKLPGANIYSALSEDRRPMSGQTAEKLRGVMGYDLHVQAVKKQPPERLDTVQGEFNYGNVTLLDTIMRPEGYQLLVIRKATSIETTGSMVDVIVRNRDSGHLSTLSFKIEHWSKFTSTKAQDIYKEVKHHVVKMDTACNFLKSHQHTCVPVVAVRKVLHGSLP
jgi:hypothetical protein